MFYFIGDNVQPYRYVHIVLLMHRHLQMETQVKPLPNNIIKGKSMEKIYNLPTLITRKLEWSYKY